MFPQAENTADVQLGWIKEILQWTKLEKTDRCDIPLASCIAGPKLWDFEEQEIDRMLTMDVMKNW